MVAAWAGHNSNDSQAATPAHCRDVRGRLGVQAQKLCVVWITSCHDAGASKSCLMSLWIFLVENNPIS